MQRDKIRDEYFKKEGFFVLRFNNVEVANNLDGVLEVIWQRLRKEKE